MRKISQNGIAQLAQKCGGEPITIIEVDWTIGVTCSYADKTIGTIPGKIIEVGDMDNAVGISDSTSSQELTVTLDDTDGSLKAIFDTHDIHKRPARVYQYFSSLAIEDKFLLFAGKISSPIMWNEKDRTVKFSIISQLENLEVGFSAEEGQFPFLPADMVGKAWPLIFGTVLNCPALQVTEAITGTTLTGAGIVSGLGEMSGLDTGGAQSNNYAAYRQANFLRLAASCWQFVDAAKSRQLMDQANKIHDQIAQQEAQQACQRAAAAAQKDSQINAAQTGLGSNPIIILGGEDFPQNQIITLNINGGLFTGSFNGNQFTVTDRSNPIGDAAAASAFAKTTAQYNCDHGSWTPYELKCEVPPGSNCEIGGYGSGLMIWEGIDITYPKSGNQQSSSPVAGQFWADAGTSVSIASDQFITYIASITPGTVLTVRAYKQFPGERCLVDVPTDLYYVETKNYGSITAVQVIFYKPLSSLTTTTVTQDPNGGTVELGTYVSQGWSDDIYVTFQSTVGPNIVDILEYLITNYSTGLTWDTTFASVRDDLAPFPANFALLDRKNILTVLQEIAFQARCALWLSDDVFAIKYLPKTPTPVSIENGGTITVTDLDADTDLEISLTPTEELVTKMRIKWRLSLTPWTDRPQDTNENLMILRHNVSKYGIQQQEYDFYIYNQPDIIYKCATFWLMRKSTTWKKVTFKTFLNKLNLETFDAVTLNIGYFATGTILALIDSAQYSSTDNTINFTCSLPVAAGDMTQYHYYWPSALDYSDTWPSAADIAADNVGGAGIGTRAMGDLPLGTLPPGIGTTIFVGGPNILFRGQSDRGDNHISDNGFTAQGVINPSIYGQITNSMRPDLDLNIYWAKDIPPVAVQDMKAGFAIDIRTTKIIDSHHPDQRPATLDSVIHGITDQQIVLSTYALFGDMAHDSGREYAFKYDGETDQYGSEICFLED